MRFQTHNVHVTKCLPENLPFIYRVGGPYRESLCVRSVDQGHSFFFNTSIQRDSNLWRKWCIGNESYRLGSYYAAVLVMHNIARCNCSVFWNDVCRDEFFSLFSLACVKFEQTLILSIVKLSLCVAFLKFTIWVCCSLEAVDPEADSHG